MGSVQNLFANLPAHSPTEVFEPLLKTDSVRIERIVSKGHSTPISQWYDQDHEEWVLVLQGKAILRIEGQEELVPLNPGDSIFLPAHLRHRVEWTDPGELTIWLAIHITAPPP